MKRFRAATFAAGFVLAAAGLTDVATGDEFSIPSYRDSEAAIDWSWPSPGIDVARPRFSGMPAQPFDRVAIDVRSPYWGSGGGVGVDPTRAKVMNARINEFALRVLQSRLEELGVAERIQVTFFNSIFLFSTPKELRDCSTLAVEIQFNLIEQTLQDRKVVALVGDLLASQQSMETDRGSGTERCSVSGPPWVVHDGPRLSLMAERDDATIEREIQGQILQMIDFMVVPQIVNSREEARALVNSWRDSGN